MRKKVKDSMVYSGDTIVRFFDVINEKMLGSVTVNFYTNEIKKTKGPILEIGTGTGRILSRALECGADIYGIDISKAMLDFLKKKSLVKIFLD